MRLGHIGLVAKDPAALAAVQDVLNRNQGVLREPAAVVAVSVAIFCFGPRSQDVTAD